MILLLKGGATNELKIYYLTNILCITRFTIIWHGVLGEGAILLPAGETHVEDGLCAVAEVILTGNANIGLVHYDGNADHLNLLNFSPDRDESE